MNYEELTTHVKGVVQALAPDAKVMLYGSRARNEARPDSDWDLLIVLNSSADGEIKARIQNALYDVELASGEVLNAIIHGKDEWESPLFRIMPFHEYVMQEGILL